MIWLIMGSNYLSFSFIYIYIYIFFFKIKIIGFIFWNKGSTDFVIKGKPNVLKKNSLEFLV